MTPLPFPNFEFLEVWEPPWCIVEAYGWSPQSPFKFLQAEAMMCVRTLAQASVSCVT